MDWTLLVDSTERIQSFETKCLWKRLRISYVEHETNGFVRSKMSFLWVQWKLFWQLSRDGNLPGSGMLPATKASPKPSLRASWRTGDAVIGKGNAEWTGSKSERPCSCQNQSQGLPVKTGKGYLLHRPSCSPDDPIGQGNELI